MPVVFMSSRDVQRPSLKHAVLKNYVAAIAWATLRSEDHLCVHSPLCASLTFGRFEFFDLDFS